MKATTLAALEQRARLQPRALSETQWQEWLLDTARGLGWLAYHTFDSRKSAPGYPDLTLVRAGRLIYAELKAQDGKTTPAQAEWLRELGGCLGVSVYVWRPTDLAEVLSTLS